MSYQETADNHGIDPADAGSVLLAAGAVETPPVLCHGASDSIGITEGQTKEEVRRRLQDALERLESEDDVETRAQLAGQIDPETADDIEKENSTDDRTVIYVLIDNAKGLIRKTLRWLDV